MADLQVGNMVGIAARGGPPGGTLPYSPLRGGPTFSLALITAHAANQVTVDDVTRIRPGVNYSIGQDSAGVAANDVLVTSVASTGIVIYSGTDRSGVISDGNSKLYVNRFHQKVSPTNMSGGYDVREGFHRHGDFLSIQSMRDRLAIINPTYYTAVMLNGLTFNDLVYALRLADAPGSI